MTREIRIGLWWLEACFPVGDAHEHVAVYCLQNEDGTVVVDTGSFHHRDALLQGIGEVTGGRGPEALVLSHTDYPHAANWESLRDQWGEVEVIASSATPSIQGLPADARHSEAGRSLEVCGRELAFVDPPLADRSHTTWVYDPATKTLFTADGFGARHQSGECTRLASELADGRVPADRIQDYHAETLVWLQYVDPDHLWRAVESVFNRYDIEVVAPTHGPPLTGSALEAYRQDFKAAVEQIVAETDPAAGETLYGP